MTRNLMRLLLILLLTLAVECACSRAQQTVQLTFAGDVTLGCEERIRMKHNSFDSYARRCGYDYFFEHVRPLFEKDDLTVVNLEGVLSDSSEGEDTKKTYRFRGAQDYAQILSRGSIEAVNLANNHTLDYGERGAADTKEALGNQGIAHFGRRDAYIYEKGNIRIAFFGLSYSDMRRADREWAADEMQRLRREENVNAVVFMFHAGREYSEARTEKQMEYARWAVDAGADLVVMHHPHVVQGMSVLDNRSVLYSLGNFCFGGNTRVRALESLVAAAELTFEDDGTYLGQRITLYPAHVSGDEQSNDYQPRLVKGSDARQVMRLVQADTRFRLSPVDEETGAAAQEMLPADKS